MNFNPSSSTFSSCLSSLFTTPSHTLSGCVKAIYWMEKYLLQTRLTPVCHNLFLETDHISIRLLDLLCFFLLVKNKTVEGGFWEPEKERRLSSSPPQPWQPRVRGRAKECRRIWASKEKPCYMEYNFTRSLLCGAGWFRTGPLS